MMTYMLRIFVVSIPTLHSRSTIYRTANVHVGEYILLGLLGQAVELIARVVCANVFAVKEDVATRAGRQRSGSGVRRVESVSAWARPAVRRVNGENRPWTPASVTSGSCHNIAPHRSSFHENTDLKETEIIVQNRKQHLEQQKFSYLLLLRWQY